MCALFQSVVSVCVVFKMDDGKTISGSKLMLVLLFLVSLVSVVAIIVAAVSLTDSDSNTPSINVNSGPATGSSGSNTPIVINAGGPEAKPSGKRIFKLAVGHDFAAQHYLDQKGYLAGFTKDLIIAVCEIGGLDCRLIWDEYTNCWNSEPGKHSFGGKGLFNGWYDACCGWMGTVGRVQVFDFSLPFSKPPATYFYVLNSTGDFNAQDITDMKIGFMDGWGADEKCLARQTGITGNMLPVEDVIHYVERPDAVKGLQNKEVNALYGTTGTFATFSALKPVGVALNCATQGLSLMTTKDNDFSSYWNRAFQKFKDSGKFSKLCKQGEQDHTHAGELYPCVDAP